MNGVARPTGGALEGGRGIIRPPPEIDALVRRALRKEGKQEEGKREF